MRIRARTGACVLLFAASGLSPLPVTSLPAQQPLRALLPEACLVAVEAPAPVALYDDLLAGFTPVPTRLPDEVRATLSVGLLALPWLLGESPRALVDNLARGGAVLGLAPGGGGPSLHGNGRGFLILRPGDAAAAARWFQHRGSKVPWHAQAEYLLAATNDADLKSLAASVASGTAGRFASWPSSFGEDAGVRAFVDLEGLRKASGRGERLGENLDGGGRFLFGALAAALGQAGHATLALSVATGGLRLGAEIDCSTAETPFGALSRHGTTARTMPAPPPGTLLSVSFDRSLHALFTGLDRFLLPEQKLGAQAFLSVADQVDGHSSFVDDLIGGLVEPIHGYVIEPPPAAGEVEPKLLLPGFAFVAAVSGKDVETILWRTAQAFTLIVNAERGQRNQPPFRVGRWNEGGWHGLSGELFEWRGPGAPPIEQALSPTLLFGHGHACLASTREAAIAVLGQVAAGRTSTLTGDRIELQGPALARTLARNRDGLELARMLDEGETRSESHRFWSVLEVVLAELATVRLSLVPGEHRTTLELLVQRQR